MSKSARSLPTRNEEALGQLVRARLEQAAPKLHEWLERAVLKLGLERFLHEEFQRLTSSELAELFAYHCPVTGARPEDYKNRLLDLPVLGQTLTGIRFWSLNLDRPFVTVIASTWLPKNQQELREATDMLRSVYDVFRPRRLRLFLPPDSLLQPEIEGQFWEKRLFAAPISELVQRPTPSGYERVELRRWQGTHSYPKYRRAFEELTRKQPAFREYTRLESKETLAELDEAGHVYDVLVDDCWSGLTAVDEAGEEGVYGYLMIEILLDEHARGKRLASAVQRHLIEQLPDKRRLLVGTIDSRNSAAIRAAARLGRSDVGGYFWSPLAAED
jgi:GNAT superfamily N-acetyltransferase